MIDITSDQGCPTRLGATPARDGTHVAVVSRHAETIELCLFDAAGTLETARLALPGAKGDIRFGFVPGLAPGTRYGLRAHGPNAPGEGHRFDPAKLLVDPYAVAIDRPFQFHPAMKAPLSHRIDSAPYMPKAIVSDLSRDAAPMPFAAPGLTYEVLVRAFSQNHPDVPERFRGTVSALAHPSLLDHLERIGVDTVELMPLAACIDEEHLVRLGLTNAWGYNPVTHMAPDPRLVPGGFAELRRVVDALHARGIRVLVDVVLNHSGEGDGNGPTLSYRGLDNKLYYAHDSDDPARLINDTGCGNTFAAWREPVARLFVDSLRTWVEAAGIDGFRYDLAPVLGRTPHGFDPAAPFLRLVARDPVLKDRIHVAESWDIGPGGYQVGQFPPPWFEWQDRFRDDVRRFWRGDKGTIANLATRIAGSQDLFGQPGRKPSAGVNFIAAHDGYALADLTAYVTKHNEANGEKNHDGHGENYSWNNGREGDTKDPAILAARKRDIRAMLATLFISRGTPMIVAGDEFGRSQGGNNNAYCQDNKTTWLDWEGADEALIAFTARLSRLRRDHPALSADAFLTGHHGGGPMEDVVWLREDGQRMRTSDWHDSDRHFLGMSLFERREDEGRQIERVIVYLNAAGSDVETLPPSARPHHGLTLFLQSDSPELPPRRLGAGERLIVKARSVFVLVETDLRVAR
ncbi:glycogen debranching protein GlgX [Fulvimarina sp. 2208YS6-2-32]|uniref:Glycogen debranching protein GlgX n=1 Tax=Fulvimarina uroteuthidis TaxID=3098149 RepID=A0ABU5HYG8_9HYPH|nr:glycogen debranching protein GlgX [Fulvimarina sp. 2208YS6-2-32]MDY8108178.1 glycogen debranching protein GlgX [Fulvimarina sp. 2208YS6-2-32]